MGPRNFRSGEGELENILGEKARIVLIRAVSKVNGNTTTSVRAKKSSLRPRLLSSSGKERLEGRMRIEVNSDAAYWVRPIFSHWAGRGKWDGRGRD